MTADARLGVDVGGTHTDAVVLDAQARFVAKAKVPTTADITQGVRTAIARVLRVGDVGAEAIGSVMLGTTHATNAILERRNLRRVAVVRIGAPLTRALPPLSTWPEDLRAVVSVGETIVGGGCEYDGQALAPLDTDAVARFLQSVAGRADGVAIIGVFSPVSPAHEFAAAEVVRRELGVVDVCLSHEIGSIGLIERENSTVLNAALMGAAREMGRALREGLGDQGIVAESFFAQNDGTLMTLEQAIRFPVLTIRSGPANSLRGAAHLTGLLDAVVADIGGTSTDIGVLVNGYPRESSFPANIAGIRTNSRMPDVSSLPIGGGSVIASGGGRLRVGPDSVGYRLPSSGLVFGGSIATLTDAAVAGGRAELGTVRPSPAQRRSLRRALVRADGLLIEAIDRAKLNSSTCPLVLVGGGSIVAPEAIPGISGIVRPEGFDVANAIGAAIAPVSGHAERICPNRPDLRNAAIDETCAEAIARATHAGADAGRVQVVEVEEVPLTYLVDAAVQIRVKAVGPRQ